MCGRYRLSRRKEFLAEHFDVEPDEDWEPRYNIAPSQSVPVIRQHPEESKRLGSSMRWGLIPFWAKDPSIGSKMINARAETVATKPAFRDALKKRRCLIPADGFYEWKKNGPKAKTPFCFTMADHNIFALAGIWNCWKNPDGQMVATCSIITTTPNTLLADVHDRMPVILPNDFYDLWLDPGFQKTDGICELLRPFDPALMRRYEVSRRVNLVKNDDPACAEPVVRAGAAVF
jgi:putative SOS response-associated peptidase YedK